MCTYPFHLVLCQVDENFYLAPHMLPSTKVWLCENFGRPMAMDAGWEVYASVEGHCIELICEEMDEWQLHVQLASELGNLRFSRQVCCLARSLGCRLYSPEFEAVIEPTLEEVQRLILRSEAWDHVMQSGALVLPSTSLNQVAADRQ